MCLYVCASLRGNRARAHSSPGTNRTVVIVVINEHVTDKGKKATHGGLESTGLNVLSHTHSHSHKHVHRCKTAFTSAALARQSLQCIYTSRLHDYIVNIQNQISLLFQLLCIYLILYQFISFCLSPKSVRIFIFSPSLFSFLSFSVFVPAFY